MKHQERHVSNPETDNSWLENNYGFERFKYSTWGLPFKCVSFLLLVFREDISVITKLVGAAPVLFFGCLYFFPILFLLPKDSLRG